MNSLPDSGLILYASRNFSLSTTKLSQKADGPAGAGKQAEPRPAPARTGECLPEPVIMDLAANLPDAVYYTGHCTCDKALAILTRELREIHPLMTGTVIEA